MSEGYTRQSEFTDGDLIEAQDHNDEFDQLEAAFDGTGGHAHDGSTGNGPVIGLIGDAGVATPLNKVVVSTANDRIEISVDVASASVAQVYFQDGVFRPVTTNDVDLGTSSYKFKDAYIDGVAYIDAINFNGTAITSTAAELNKLAGTPAGLTATEIGYLDGVTSAIQTQLDSKISELGGASVDNELVLWSGTGGDTLKRATTTGVLKATSGVIGAAVSGTDLKTVGGTSIIGSGDISIEGGISTVVTATTATTLTSTKTLLQITPASYGVIVTLADATTCDEGGPQYIIDNRGAYPVLLNNNSGTLLGFVPGGVTSYVSLDDNATAAGTWCASGLERTGVSAKLLTTVLDQINKVCAIDSDRDFILGTDGATGYVYAAVHRKSTNAWAGPTLIRGANCTKFTCIKSATNQMLVVSCTGTTALEAVTCSIDASTDAITPNSGQLDAETLSANIDFFDPQAALFQVGTSFIICYSVDTPAAQIREITISGVTPTISAATSLGGTIAPLAIAANSTTLIATSFTSTTMYIRSYTIGGLAAGTGATQAIGTWSGPGNQDKITALGTRWVRTAYASDTDIGTWAFVISLSGTTVTQTNVKLLAGVMGDAGVVNGMLLGLSTATTNNANLLTDTAGTASAGTAITLDSSTNRSIVYVDGSDAFVRSGTTNYRAYKISCSGSSPAISEVLWNASNGSDSQLGAFGTSDYVLNNNANFVRGTRFAQLITVLNQTDMAMAKVDDGVFSLNGQRRFAPVSGGQYRGAAANERYVTDQSSVLYKVECAA